jgi:CRP-like cAMP-binding protein
MAANENLLLARLPPAIRERIGPRLERVELAVGQQLLDIGEPVPYAYFPTGGFLSLETWADNGDNLELTTVGCEGMIGVPILLQEDSAPHRVVVRVSGPALRIRRRALRDELGQIAELRDVLLAYAAIHVRDISRAALCHHAHNVLQRVCRRILTAADRLEAQTLDMSHEDLAQALGVARTAVGDALIELQRADALWSQRGRIILLKRPMLESTACDCYLTWRDQIRSLAAGGQVKGRTVRP